MTSSLKEMLALYIEGGYRTTGPLAPLPQLNEFKLLIQTDVQLAENLLSGNLRDILIHMNKMGEFFEDHDERYMQQTKILIIFLCDRWQIEAVRRYID